LKTPEKIVEYLSRYFGKCVVLEVQERLALNKETKGDAKEKSVPCRSEEES